MQKQIIGRLKYPLDVYVAGAEKMVKLVTENPDVAARAMPDFLKKFETLEGGMADASKQFEEEQAAVAEEATRASPAAQTYLLGLLAAGLAAAGIISLAVRRSVVRPMLDMTAAMKRLAEGDVAVSMPSADRKDEIGPMARALVVLRKVGRIAQRQR